MRPIAFWSLVSVTLPGLSGVAVCRVEDAWIKRLLPPADGAVDSVGNAYVDGDGGA